MASPVVLLLLLLQQPQEPSPDKQEEAAAPVRPEWIVKTPSAPDRMYFRGIRTGVPVMEDAYEDAAKSALAAAVEYLWADVESDYTKIREEAQQAARTEIKSWLRVKSSGGVSGKRVEQFYYEKWTRKGKTEFDAWVLVTFPNADLEAIRAAKKIEVEEATRLSPERLDREARLRMEAGEYGSAVVPLKTLLAAAPGNVRVRLNLAECYASLESRHQAMEQFLTILATAPDSEEAKIAETRRKLLLDRWYAEAEREMTRLNDQGEYAQSMHVVSRVPPSDARLKNLVGPYVTALGRHIAGRLLAGQSLGSEAKIWVDDVRMEMRHTPIQAGTLKQEILGGLQRARVPVTAAKEGATHVIAPFVGQTASARLTNLEGDMINVVSALPVMTLEVDLKQFAKPEVGLEVLMYVYQWVKGKKVRRKVVEGDVLFQNDEFYLLLRPTTPCFGYVITLSPEGRADLLFPHPAIREDNFLRAEQAVTLPGPDSNGKEQVLTLEGPRGTETIYVIVSLEPLANLARLIADMRAAAGEKLAKARKKLDEELTRFRDIRIKPAAPGEAGGVTGENVRAATDVVRGRDAVMRVLTFEHR